MKIILFTYFQRLFRLNFLINSKTFQCVLYALFLVGLPKLVSAQEVNDLEKIKAATISVIGGAQIYSQDEALNKQIAQKHILVNGSIVSYDSDDFTKKLVITDKKLKKEAEKSFATDVRESVNKKKEKLSKETRQELAQYEKRKENFANEKIGNPFSPDHFFSSQITSKNYGAPRVENYKNSKLELSIYSYVVKLALDHLHSQYYTFYNNRSFDQCFSKVFSVRPPPVLA